VDGSPILARRFFDRFEPVHAVTYFAPEARQAFDALGFKGFWMGYFAARSAPLGPGPGGPPANLVTATFYNFTPRRVAQALPAAWDYASPQAALRARARSAVAALRRYGITDDENVRTAAELAAKAAQTAPVDGRPLFAANSALDWPDEPIEMLWHATTLLREHRGDGHVAVLTAAGIGGRDSNVLHCAAGAVSEEFIRRSRDYDDQEWRVCCERLAARGLLEDGRRVEGALTAAGLHLKEEIEAATNTLALTALDGLTDAEVEALFTALTPLARTVIAGGDLPESTPMGMRRDELDDNSAHLT
jgi:Helix-turn-helix family